MTNWLPERGKALRGGSAEAYEATQLQERGADRRRGNEWGNECLSSLEFRWEKGGREATVGCLADDVTINKGNRGGRRTERGEKTGRRRHGTQRCAASSRKKSEAPRSSESQGALENLALN